MRLVPHGRACLMLALAAVAVGVPAATLDARPRPEPTIAAPPPPPPTPDASLGSRLLRDAAAYQGYLHRAEQISPNFASAQHVAQSLQTSAAYEPGQFLRGEIAYGAVAAMQSPQFVAAVRAAGQTPEARYQVVRRIFADPANVFAFPGATAAAGLARQAIAGEGMRLFNVGKTVKQAAYDIQHQPWSLQEVPGRDARLQAVKDGSRAPMPVGPSDMATLAQASGGAQVLGLAPDTDPSTHYSRLIIRSVALAALGAIGQAGDEQVGNITWLLDDYYTSHCLTEAKLALNGCLAVAKPNYEDVFCIGQHILSDTGACMVRGAGSAIPLEIRTQPLKIPPPKHQAPARRAGRRH